MLLLWPDDFIHLAGSHTKDSEGHAENEKLYLFMLLFARETLYSYGVLSRQGVVSYSRTIYT